MITRLIAKLGIIYTTWQAARRQCSKSSVTAAALCLHRSADYKRSMGSAGRWVSQLQQQQQCALCCAENVTSAGWRVTLCDSMWHVSSRSGLATLRTAIHLLLTNR